MFWKKTYEHVRANLETLATDVLRRAEDPELVNCFQSLEVAVQRSNKTYSIKHKCHALLGPKVEVEGPKDSNGSSDYKTIVEKVAAAIDKKSDNIQDLPMSRVRTTMEFGTPQEWQNSYAMTKIADYLDAYRNLGGITQAILYFKNVSKSVYDKAIKAELPLQEFKPTDE